MCAGQPRALGQCAAGQLVMLLPRTEARDHDRAVQRDHRRKRSRVSRAMSVVSTGISRSVTATAPWSRSCRSIGVGGAKGNANGGCTCARTGPDRRPDQRLACGQGAASTNLITTPCPDDHGRNTRPERGTRRPDATVDPDPTYEQVVLALNVIDLRDDGFPAQGEGVQGRLPVNASGALTGFASPDGHEDVRGHPRGGEIRPGCR